MMKQQGRTAYEITRAITKQVADSSIVNEGTVQALITAHVKEDRRSPFTQIWLDLPKANRDAISKSILEDALKLQVNRLKARF